MHSEYHGIHYIGYFPLSSYMSFNICEGGGGGGGLVFQPFKTCHFYQLPHYASTYICQYYQDTCNPWKPHFDILGVPIGAYLFCGNFIVSKCHEGQRLLSKLKDIADRDPQVALPSFVSVMVTVALIIWLKLFQLHLLYRCLMLMCASDS